VRVDGRRPSRRTLLLGAAGVSAAAVVGLAAGVDEGGLPGRTRIRSELGLDGRAGHVPSAAPGRVVSGAFVSRARGGVLTRWTIARPPGAAGALPVLVVLHGLGGDHTTAMASHLGLDHFQAAGARDGLPPFAIASVDGGTA
jgi:hypothetical protein